MKKKGGGIHCIFKASIGLLGSEIEIKELDLMLFIELNLQMQFVVKKAQLCLGASPLTFCFPEASH